jgi:CelD/BcsL family acetyltransferase involved in cellulose biosynthesis
VLALHREAAPALLARGLLRLHVLWVGERAAGALLGFADRAWAAAYLSGFDPAFRLGSPGAVLFLRAIEEAIAGGARTFDFLRGREPYKYDWGATDRPARRRMFGVAADGRSHHDAAPHARRSPACASQPPQS